MKIALSKQILGWIMKIVSMRVFNLCAGMPRPMSFFPNLLAILALLLPHGSGELADPIVLGSPVVHGTDRGQETLSQIFCPTEVPSQSESFFECIDESALDEEDSSRVEDHGVVPLTLLDYQPPLGCLLFSALLPAQSHDRLSTSTSILRC